MDNAKTKQKDLPDNSFPHYDASDNPTNCCPRFNPEGWNDQDLYFKDKLFVRAKTKSLMHVPLNMGKVFSHTFKAIEEADAMNRDQCVVLSRDISPWVGEHFFPSKNLYPAKKWIEFPATSARWFLRARIRKLKNGMRN